MDIQSNFFGTCGSSKTLPTDLASKPFDNPDSVAYLYCSSCGVILELDRKQLADVLVLVNIRDDTNLTVDDFVSCKQYIFGFGCPNCSEYPSMTVKKIGS